MQTKMITKEQIEKIEKIKEKIEKFAGQIYDVNSDNIESLSDFSYETDKTYFEKMKEVMKEENRKISDLAVELVEKFDINVYGAFYYVGFVDKEMKIFESKTVEEFIENLEEYQKDLESWADDEIDCFDEAANITDIDLSDAEYIVKVYRIAPCWADGYLEAIIRCENEKQAEKVSEKVEEGWGDFGISGANVNTKIVKVDENTEREIKEEMRDDMTRLAKNNHLIDVCEVLDSDDVIDDVDIEEED